MEAFLLKINIEIEGGPTLPLTLFYRQNMSK